MSGPALGRLEKVDLRTAWASESSGFTPWLALPENLSLLGETIGISLECEAQEKYVGPFRADILCKDTVTDSWVLIENQLERTDHSHLGQLITYAAGLDAVIIIWIAQRFTEEHRAALDWLNQRTDADIRIFGLEIELWRIGDSTPAPKFNIVSKPNDWSRDVKHITDQSDLQQLQLRFWTAFKQSLEARSSPVRLTRRLNSHVIHYTLGRSGIHLASVISRSDLETGANQPHVRADLILNGPTAREQFDALHADREAIEATLGFPVAWLPGHDAARCRVSSSLQSDYTVEANWPQQHQWLAGRLEAMQRVFTPRVQTL